MTGRPPPLSPFRLLVGLVAPLVAYVVIRVLTGSSVGALVVTDAVPSAWLLVAAVVARRVDPIAVLCSATVIIAFAAYALSGGDPLAIELRRGSVTGLVGIVGLASVALGRPLFLVVAERLASLNPDPEMTARLAQPERRRGVTILTAIVAATFALDGATQIALALTVRISSFVPDSTAARIVVFGTGAVVTIQYLRSQKVRLNRGLQGPPDHTDHRA